MAKARVEEFPDKENTLADFAKALSHPARIAILKFVAAKQECICGDIVADLPLAQSTVSQHLKALKDVGLLKGEVDGPRTCYCVDWKNLKKFQSMMLATFSEISIFESPTKC